MAEDLRDSQESSSNESDEDDDIMPQDLVLFIQTYQHYLDDTSVVERGSTNAEKYKNNSQKVLNEWFESEGYELNIKTEQLGSNKFSASIDLTVCDKDFSIVSEVHDKKQAAIDEACKRSCWILDESGQLFRSNEPSREDRKRLFDEANKEDDIVYDNTLSTKRQRGNLETDRDEVGQSATAKPKVNTYESLMADWNRLNMSILQMKAKLVKLDVSLDADKNQRVEVDNEDDDDVDPLDAYMTSLDEKKKKPTLDDKIEKSRLKTHISALQREQAQISKLIELTKPSFDLDKAMPLRPSKDIKHT